MGLAIDGNQVHGFANNGTAFVDASQMDSLKSFKAQAKQADGLVLNVFAPSAVDPSDTEEVKIKVSVSDEGDVGVSGA